MNPMDFAQAFRPEQWIANTTSYARTILTELEKQTGCWAEYGASQSNEAAGLLRAFQTQAFQLSKSLIDTAEKAFAKSGS